MHTRRVPVFIVAIMAAATARADVELVQEHVFDARPGQTVAIDVSFHSVEVSVEPGSSVHALVELSTSSSSSKAARAIEELRPVFEVKGDTLVIRSTRSGSWNWSNGKVKGKVSVTIPPGLDLSIDSSSGSITVDGDLGDAAVTCDASSGSVTVRGAMRSLQVDTSSGSIRAELSRPLERFSADASSGSVRLSGGAHDASADTSSGSITATGLLGDAKLDASSGSIEAQWDSIPPGASIKAGASSGSVTLKLPPGTALSGTVSTGSGGVQSDFPGSFDRKSASFSGGTGAVELRVSTSSGSVKILSD